MVIGVTNIVVVVLLVGAGQFYGIAGTLVALPVSILFSIGTEKLINQIQPNHSLESLRWR